MTTPFRYYLRVRYQECDAQNVVFNARYADYVDPACFDFCARAAVADRRLRRLLRVPDRAAGHRVEGAARLDNVLEISMRASRIGTTSLTLSAEMRRAGEAEILVTTETVYVHVDHKTFTKREIEPKMRAALEAGARGKTTDHAGYLR